MPPADQKYNQIMELLGRDYSKRKNPGYDASDPNSQQYNYGKDYDKTHNWKDVLRGIGLGALQAGANAPAGASTGRLLGNILGGAAGGGVSAGVDRNADNKMLDELKLRQMLPEYQTAYGLEQQRTNDALKQNQIRTATDNINVDNTRMQADLERKKAADASKDKYYTGLLKEKSLTREQTQALRTRALDLRESGQNEKADEYDRKATEQERHNQVTEKQAATNEQGRDTRFGTAQQNQMSRQQIGIAAKLAAANLKAAVASGQMERAAQLRKELEDYKSQLTLGSTPQQ
jgi:hypothetical protein